MGQPHTCATVPLMPDASRSTERATDGWVTAEPLDSKHPRPYIAAGPHLVGHRIVQHVRAIPAGSSRVQVLITLGCRVSQLPPWKGTPRLWPGIVSGRWVYYQVVMAVLRMQVGLLWVCIGTRHSRSRCMTGPHLWVTTAEAETRERYSLGNVTECVTGTPLPAPVVQRCCRKLHGGL